MDFIKRDGALRFDPREVLATGFRKGTASILAGLWSDAPQDLLRR
jgi:hypothetical protein